MTRRAASDRPFAEWSRRVHPPRSLAAGVALACIHRDGLGPYSLAWQTPDMPGPAFVRAPLPELWARFKRMRHEHRDRDLDPVLTFVLATLDGPRELRARHPRELRDALVEAGLPERDAFSLAGTAWHGPHPQLRRKEKETASSVLTPRQRQVLRLVALGRANPEIARELGISPRTVQTHVSELLGILNATRRTLLVAHALRLGVLEPADVPGSPAPKGPSITTPVERTSRISAPPGRP